MLTISSLQAQVTKEVEVTKKYVPQVEQPTKPILKATMSDTAQITPEIDYSVTPLSINTSLTTKPINPATITYWEFNRPTYFYVKAGAGAPLNTVLDLYAASQNSSTGYVMAHANHEGRYSKIDDLFGAKQRANRSLNDVGASGGLYLGNQTLEGDFNYSNDMRYRYALPLVGGDQRVNYQNLDAKVRYGDDFVDLSYFNFGVEGDYNYFVDNFSSSNSSASIATMVAKSSGKWGYNASLGFDYTTNGVNYTNRTLNAGFTYSFVGNNWICDLGGAYHHDAIELATNTYNSNYFLPEVNIRYKHNPRLIPYITFNGDLHHNNFAELAEQNPYVASGAFATVNSLDYNLRAGIHGLTGSEEFEYNLYVGYSIMRNAHFWAFTIIEEEASALDDNYEVTFEDSYFSSTLGNQYQASINVELKYRPISDLIFGFDLHSYNYSREYVNQIAYTQPKFISIIEAEYSKDKWNFAFNCEALGERYYTQIIEGVSSTPVRISPSVDLNLKAEYQFSSDMVIFLGIDNLCNSTVYEFPAYLDYGISAMAGVKIQF